MENSSPGGPWAIYRTPVRPSSAKRVLLADLLEFVVGELGGEPDEDLAITFFRTDQYAEQDRASLRSYIRWLGKQFIEGRLTSYVRPFGGGESEPLPASHWEVDDFEHRFAWSAIDPRRWTDVEAAPTHWIFVSEDSIDRWWEDWCREGEACPSDILQPISVERRAMDETNEPSAPLTFLRVRDVADMTGLSRSTIYDRIREGRFPTPVRMGMRMSRWRSDEVREWLARSGIS